MSSITYKDSGVDIDKADRIMDTLKTRIQGTFKPFVLNPIGGFGALTEIPKGYVNPVLVSSTDGVGTKLKIAFLADKHDTVGIDLVAMSVNDVLTLGAKPLFFLDYFGCGKLEESSYTQVISGVCDGCRMADCALVGGETAEMPSFYPPGEYDLAGFAVGVVEKDRIVNGSTIQEGDIIVGLASSGLHSNGYSLVRRVLLELHHLDVNAGVEGIDGKLHEELLKPTRIYVRPVLDVLSSFTVKGMAHITGGGLPGNIKRVVPQGLMASIHVPEERIPYIFKLIMKLGNVPLEEMYSTFNMGIGFAVVINARDEEAVMESFSRTGETPLVIGRIEKSSEDAKVKLRFDTE